MLRSGPQSNRKSDGNGVKSERSNPRRLIILAPLRSLDGGTAEYVRIEAPSSTDIEALKDIRISQEAWKATRKSWVRQARKLSQADGMETVPIPKLYLRTAILCQYMNDSLLVLYEKANPDGTQLYKLVEYDEETIHVFTQNGVKREDDLCDLFSDYFEFHGVVPIGGVMKIDTFREIEGRVKKKVFDPTPSAKRTVSHTHKRAVHSISSAPLARPPTSPVTPRTAVPPIAPPTREGSKVKKKYERKGIIGVAIGSNGYGKEKDSHNTQRWKGKSLSVSLSPQDLDTALATPGTPPLRDGSVPAHHPHARRQSVQDVQLEAQLQVKELSSPALAPSGSASTSAFSLSLDTISETNSDTHQYPPKRRPPNFGLGLGPPPLGQEGLRPPHSAYPSTFAQPGTELVLYAYAQLSGTVTLGGDVAQGESRAQAQALNAVRFALQKKQAFGGGRMDISSTLEGRAAETTQAQRRSRSHAYGHNRAASLSSSLMSLLSPPPPTRQPWAPGHKAHSPSLIASFLSPSVSSPASIGSSSTSGTTLDATEEVPPDTPLPVFEVQPAMLAVDLVLAPGESRTYTYSLPLPSTLPPTYRGRNIKFAYHLSVGVCRSTPGPSPSSPGGKGSTSQVMRVPIRVYNHVDVSGVQSAYDLLWPILHPPSKEQMAQVREISTSSASGRKESKGDRSPSTHRTPSQSLSPEPGTDTALELRDYALRLLSTLPDSSGDGIRLPADIEALSPTTQAEREMRSRGGGELTGCREAVEILTRNMRKVSYDVNKDGIKVAVLTFTKSAYRLGETVIGVVELNDISSRARVLKLSAMLEAHETLPDSLNQSSQGAKKLRKLHAEYHTSLTLSTLRTSFALDIPSDATPAFQYVCAPPFSSSSALPAPSKSTTGLGLTGQANEGTPGGLTWTVRLCLLVGVASPYARKGVAGGCVKGLVRDGPHGEWGTAWRATRGIAPLQNIDTRAARRAQQREALAASGAENGSGQQTQQQQQQQQRGWASYFFSGLLAPGEREYHDGDEDIASSSSSSSLTSSPRLSGVRELGEIDETRTVRDDMGIDLDPGGGDEGWSELRAETVECEVPIRVWPGNTAFRPLEVVFEV
ncbi:RGP1 [Sanghuangporus sanghuang]